MKRSETDRGSAADCCLQRTQAATQLATEVVGMGHSVGAADWRGSVSLVQEVLGFEFPMELIPDSMPRPDLRREKALYMSSEAAANPCLIQGTIDWFLKAAPVGYLTLGFWGHGANSYAFFFQLVDVWQRVFLRLPYGGYHMDNEENARKIARYLSAFAGLVREARERKVAQLIAVESMGYGHYRVRRADHETVEIPEPLLDCDEIEQRFKELLYV